MKTQLIFGLGLLIAHAPAMAYQYMDLGFGPHQEAVPLSINNNGLVACTYEQGYDTPGVFVASSPASRAYMGYVEEAVFIGQDNSTLTWNGSRFKIYNQAGGFVQSESNQVGDVWRKHSSSKIVGGFTPSGKPAEYNRQTGELEKIYFQDMPYFAHMVDVKETRNGTVKLMVVNTAIDGEGNALVRVMPNGEMQGIPLSNAFTNEEVASFVAYFYPDHTFDPENIFLSALLSAANTGTPEIRSTAYITQLTTWNGVITNLSMEYDVGPTSLYMRRGVVISPNNAISVLPCPTTGGIARSDVYGASPNGRYIVGVCSEDGGPATHTVWTATGRNANGGINYARTAIQNELPASFFNTFQGGIYRLNGVNNSGQIIAEARYTEYPGAGIDRTAVLFTP